MSFQANSSARSCTKRLRFYAESYLKLKNRGCGLAPSFSHLFLQDVHDSTEVCRSLEHGIRKFRTNVLELLFVVADLEFGELEAVCRADDDHVLFLVDLACGHELFEGAESHTRMRAAVETDAVAAVGCIGEFFFSDAYDHAVRLLDSADCLRVADWVTDLDRRSESFLGLHRNELVEAAFVSLEERVGVFGLSHDNARDAVDKAHGLAVFEALGESADVTEVSARDNHGVGHLPAHFLRNRLLAFYAEAVHGVGEVDAVVGSDLLNNLHATVKVGVEGEHDAAVGNRLNQLSHTRLAGGQEHNARDAGLCAVGTQGCGGIAGRGASHGVNRVNAFLDDMVHLAHENRHAEVLERTGVGVAAKLDLEALDAHFLGQRSRIKQRAPAFAHRDDVFDGHVGEHHFALAPDAAHVGGFKAHAAFGEELLPFVGALAGESCTVVFDLEQASVHLAAVNDVGQRVGIVPVDVPKMSVELRLVGS